MRMKPVKTIIALGSSSGDKHIQLRKALNFLETLTEGDITTSSIWETDPVGPAENTFLNAVVRLETSLSPGALLRSLKKYEESAGRDLSAPKWSDRVIDLDIIAYGTHVCLESDLEIPHPMYRERLFVLEPLLEIQPAWTDPENGDSIDDIIRRAPALQLSKTSLKW
jgi:2-amino-4-hydroxy-6-hydroxymethyldihydropteridine diphosphokinase